VTVTIRSFMAGALGAAALAVTAGAPSTAHAQQPPQVQPAQSAPAPAQPQGTLQNPIIVQLHPETGGVPTTVAMSGPRVINDWEPEEPVPPGYHPETRVRKGLVIGGAIPFGVFWLFSAMAAAVGEDTNYDNQALYIPAVGPFIQLPKNATSTARFFCILDGVVQTGGLAMVIYGLASPKDVLVRNDLGKLHLEPRPFIARGGGGMGLGGSF